MTKSFHRFTAIICVIVLLTALMCISAFADDETDTVAISESEEETIVMTCTEVPLYNEGNFFGTALMFDSVTYVPLLAFCESMLDSEFSIDWRQEDASVVLEADGFNLSLSVDDNYMVANNRYFYLPSGVYNINGSILVPIRELAKVFNVGIIWLEEEFAIELDCSSLQLIENGDTYYNEEDLYWLSRVIFSESGNQPLSGMIGVGNVVINRRDDESIHFPDTIKDVIFQYNQFDVVARGSIYLDPSEGAVIAAKLALEGYNTVGDCKFFFNPYVCGGGWITANSDFYTLIGEHAFYA